jgi:hypothetical protein
MFKQLIEVATRPIAVVMPEYHPDAADVNEAIDTGVASCAARAYMGALLIRDALPDKRLYAIEFGFDPHHGEDFKGSEGLYIKMGHAVTRLYIPERRPLILDSFDDGSMEVVPQDLNYDTFIWNMNPKKGYEEYLHIADIDSAIDDEEIVRCFYKQLLSSPV